MDPEGFRERELESISSMPEETDIQKAYKKYKTDSFISDHFERDAGSFHEYRARDEFISKIGKNDKISPSISSAAEYRHVAYTEPRVFKYSTTMNADSETKKFLLNQSKDISSGYLSGASLPDDEAVKYSHKHHTDKRSSINSAFSIFYQDKTGYTSNSLSNAYSERRAYKKNYYSSVESQ